MTDEHPDSWRRVFRQGFAPIVSTEILVALRDALRADDPRLTQGSTTTPPPLMAVQDWPVEAACLSAFCGVVENGGFEVATVGQVEESFARLCFDIDQRLGQPAECRHLLNFWDNTPRPDAIRELLAEIDLALAQRQESPCAPPPPSTAAG